MAKEYAQAFYHSQAWKNTRDAYYKLQRGMCERCTKELAEGRITLKDVEPGIIVHHKKHITPENINNPRVTLSFDNLELLCTRHHNEEHKSKYEKPLLLGIIYVFFESLFVVVIVVFSHTVYS